MGSTCDTAQTLTLWSHVVLMLILETVVAVVVMLMIWYLDDASSVQHYLSS